MNNFDFVSPTKIIFGRKRETEIGKQLNKLGYHKVLFHYGSGSIQKSGLFDTVIKSLTETHIDFVLLGGVTPNPKIELVRCGVELAKKENVDAILCVGGGSVIDSGKAIACGAKVDFDPWCFSNHTKTPMSALPVVTILTISAAGSECSNSCVITNSSLSIKNGFNSDLVRPTLSILDPELTMSVSPFQTSCGIVDILMHTMERYFTDTKEASLADGFALGLMNAVMEASDKIQKDDHDYDARATLMLASSFSHNGLTGLGEKMYFTVHKMEHILSGHYDNITHAAGLSILFPAWAEWMIEHLEENQKQKFITFTQVVLKKQSITELVPTIKAFYKKLSMPTSLGEYSIKKVDVDKMLDDAYEKGIHQIDGIIVLDRFALQEIFEKAL
jgi:alcohol dehydrogenase YqhD (iron-dependent ADH family)